MKRTKLSERKLPNYTREEEIFNMISHIVGAIFALCALILCVTFSAFQRNVWGIVGGAVYGFFMLGLYLMSSIYHGLIPEKPKKVLQVLDHCAIYFLIAGSYTPILLCAFRLRFPALSWMILGFVWVITALGVTFTAIDLRKYRVFAMICYLGLGWSIVIFWKQLLQSLPFRALVLIFLGGISFSVGSILYGLGKKRKYMHSVFHIFVLIGSILQFFAIFFYII